MHIYAIGDIHGHLALLTAAHARIAADMAQFGPGPVVHLGDLVDRGPDSRGVISHLIAGIEAGQDWHVLRGNHDRMFTRFLRDPYEPEPGLRAGLSWLHPKLGGGPTLVSYGVENAADRPIPPVLDEARALVPAAHVAFLDSRPKMLQMGRVLFVHAGIDPRLPLEWQSEDDLVWIRDGWLDYRGPLDQLVVHGHTALPAPVHYGHRVNIDSSAAYGGPLTAVVIDADGLVYVLTEEGRELLPVTPDAPIR